jgi:hypothetical protein
LVVVLALFALHFILTVMREWRSGPKPLVFPSPILGARTWDLGRGRLSFSAWASGVSTATIPPREAGLIWWYVEVRRDSPDGEVAWSHEYNDSWVTMESPTTMMVTQYPEEIVLPMQVVPVRLSRGAYAVSVGIKEGDLTKYFRGPPAPPPRVVIVKTIENVEVR